MKFRKATENDHARLTEISFASKKYWPYPPHYFQLWDDELTITPSYIENNHVYLCLDHHQPVGYYSFLELKSALETELISFLPGLWLDHMFLHPGYIGQGRGRVLFNHCLRIARTMDHDSINILADPFARDFYVKMGCTRRGEVASTIPGRTTPYLEYRINR